MHSIEFKFGMYITGHRRTNPIDFGEHRTNSFFTGVQKRILIHYGLWNQILQSVLVCKRCIRLSSDLVCILQATVGRNLLILVNIGCIVFLYRSTEKNSYTLRPMRSNSLKCSSIQMMHSIYLKFGMFIIGHHCTNYNNFGE